MKRHMISWQMLVFAMLTMLVHVALGEDWHCRNGKTYKDVHYIRHNLSDIQFSHSAGISIEKFSNLPSDVQKRYGYDSQKEVQARIKHKKDLEEQQKRAQELQEEKERQEALRQKVWQEQQTEMQKRQKYECITVKTNQISGITTVSLKEELEIDKSSNAKLSASVEYFVEVHSIHMRFTSIRDTSNDWRFLNYHPVIFLIDGNRWNPAENYDSDIWTRSHSLYEAISISVPLERMESIVHAQSVRFQIGVSEFFFSKGQQDKIGLFLEYLREKYNIDKTPFKGEQTPASI